MMNFINNWATTLAYEMPVAGQSLPVSQQALDELGAGVFRVTLTTEANPLKQHGNFEIVEVTIEPDGVTHISRGREGTEERAWPAQSYVYASLTAGHMAEIYRLLSWAEDVLSGTDNQDLLIQIAQLEQQVQSLEYQLQQCQSSLLDCQSALDDCMSNGGGGDVSGALTDAGGAALTDDLGNILTGDQI